MNAPASSPEKTAPAGKNALEWSVFAVSCVLVLGTIGALIYGLIVWKDSPARLVVKTGTPYQESGLTWVPVTLKNEGDRAAAAVEVEVTAASPSAGEETAAFTVDQIPHGAERGGRVSFPGTDAGRTFKARVSGYQDP